MPPPAPGAAGASGGAPKRGRVIGAPLAIAVAVLALLLAAVSMLVSWRALDQATDARDIARAGGAPAPQAPGPAPQPTEPPPTGGPAPEPPPPGDPTTTPDLPPLNEQTQYTVKYEKVSLKLQTGCNNSQYIDVDVPRVRNDSTDDDIQFTAQCGAETSYFELPQNTPASRADTPNLTPQDCARLIQTGPLGLNTRVPARKGTVLCLITSLEEAMQRGDKQRIAIVQVTGVADDGAVSVSATAWDIPN